MPLKVTKITKRFTRKIVKDYQAVEVGTEITAEVEIDSEDSSAGEKLKEASEKLGKQVRVLSMKDYDDFVIAKAAGKAV
jgi:hypothetical protein